MPFKSLKSSETENLLKNLVTTNEKIKLRILWFLSANPGVISPESFKHIIGFWTIQILLFEVLFSNCSKSNDKDLVQEVINSKWAWTSKDCFGEDYWGSLILSNLERLCPIVKFALGSSNIFRICS